jgi:hypothetical protein
VSQASKPSHLSWIGAAPGIIYDMPGLKTVNGIATGGGTKAAWFKDSEGNILAIIQMVGKEAERTSRTTATARR